MQGWMKGRQLQLMGAVLWICVLAITGIATAQAGDPIVGIAHDSSSDQVYAVSASGNAYRGRYSSSTGQTGWTYDGNLFVLCGCGAPSPLVGCAVFNNYAFALAEDGQLFIGSEGSWGPWGTMGSGPFTSLGMSSHGPSTAKCLIGVMANGQVVSQGSGGCVGGNIFDSRPTAALRKSWGQLKAERK